MGIGTRIRDLRIKSSLSQKELAKKLQVSYQAISSWERDRTEPNMGMIAKMSVIFDCQIADIVGEINREYLTISSPRENYVLSKFRKADENTKIMIERILSFVEKDRHDD